MTKILVIPDQHAHPDYNNDRADWLGQYIKESKPDVVVNIGDGADMASLSSYDKGKASFIGRSYEKDINAHLDFQHRLWSPVQKGKKKRPHTVYLIGNHEHRITKALEYSPELGGDIYGLSLNNLKLDQWYKEVVPYEGGYPGSISIGGISFAHYFTSGILGRPIGGEHPAYSLLTKNFQSCVCGHSHTADFAIRTKEDGTKIMGLLAGVYQDYDSPWAGNLNRLWWRGIVELHNVDNGYFDPHFISLNTLRKEYA